MISSVRHHAPIYGIRMPTPAESKHNDIALAKNAMARGTAKKLAHAPHGQAEVLANITPKGVMGVRTDVVRIGAHVYVTTTPVVPNAKPTWYDAGMICY